MERRLSDVPSECAPALASVRDVSVQTVLDNVILDHVIPDSSAVRIVDAPFVSATGSTPLAPGTNRTR